MRLIIVLASVFFLVSSASAQDRYEISIHPDSHLKIHGSSNVNTFICEYQKHLENATVMVSKYDPKTYYLKNASLTIAVSEFDCGHKPLTSDFQETLQADKYPHLTLEVSSIKQMGNGSQYSAELKIELAGVVHYYNVPVDIEIQEGGLVCVGSKQLKMTDFEISPPVKFMGMIRVNEEILISFTLILEGIAS